MKVSFDSEILITALTPAAAVASIRNTSGTIEGVLLECPAVEENTCRITAYDMEKGMRTTIPCEIEEEGTVIINAQNLLTIIRALRGGMIDITVNERNRAIISKGKSAFEIAVTPGDHFPQLPLLAGDRNYILPQYKLRDVISRTIYAVGVNDQRAVFNGTFFEVKDGRLHFTGCDGNRIALSYIDLPEGENPDAGVIVPGRLLMEVLRMMRDSEDDITVTLARRHIIFRLGEYVYFTRLIDATYIDCHRLLPKAHTTEVFVDTAVLREALDRTLLITEDKLGGNTRAYVKLEFEGNILRMTSTSQNGSIEEEIPVAKTGADLTIGFNCRLLADALHNVPEEVDHVRLCLNTSNLGVTIESATRLGSKFYIDKITDLGEVEEPVFLDYIMPIRMTK